MSFYSVFWFQLQKLGEVGIFLWGFSVVQVIVALGSWGYWTGFAILKTFQLWSEKDCFSFKQLIEESHRFNRKGGAEGLAHQGHFIEPWSLSKITSTSKKSREFPPKTDVSALPFVEKSSRRHHSKVWNDKCLQVKVNIKRFWRWRWLRMRSVPALQILFPVASCLARWNGHTFWSLTCEKAQFPLSHHQEPEPGK